MEATNAFAMLRKRVKMSQKDVSKQLCVSRSTVAMWETGKTIPRAEMLIKLADLFHCTVDELLRRD